MSRTFVFTSESVPEGHPDKLCDRISDAVVGSHLRQDPLARVIVECAVSTGIVFVAVKERSEGSVDVPRIVRKVIEATGYDTPDFNPRDCTIMTSVGEIPAGARLEIPEDEMDDAELAAITASTPVTVFGYACDHTESLLPLPIHLAHRLAHRLADLRKDDTLPWLAPDGSTQVSVEFEDRNPVRIQGVNVLAAHHRADADGKTSPRESEMQELLRSEVVDVVFAEEPLAPDADTIVDVKPGGVPDGGGPARHAGLTGRKTHVDTYGEYSRNSSSALSGKDPTRIDRVGAYAARHAAKAVVGAELASEAEVVLSYAPGRAEPVSVQVQTSGTGKLDDSEITDRVQEVFDFRPGAIVRRLELRRLASRDPDGFFQHLAAYGQMGRTDLDAPWERLDAVDAIR